jgi:hypothetical protein
MKTFLISFFILILISITINSVELNNYCKKIKYRKCEKLYQCGNNLCSIDEKSCRDFIEWGNIFQKFFNRPPPAYRKFINNIKNCRLKETKNQWSHRMNFG